MRVWKSVNSAGIYHKYGSLAYRILLEFHQNVWVLSNINTVKVSIILLSKHINTTVFLALSVTSSLTDVKGECERLDSRSYLLLVLVWVLFGFIVTQF